MACQVSSGAEAIPSQHPQTKPTPIANSFIPR
jgi:hypothetical protein